MWIRCHFEAHVQCLQKYHVFQIYCVCHQQLKNIYVSLFSASFLPHSFRFWLASCQKKHQAKHSLIVVIGCSLFSIYATPMKWKNILLKSGKKIIINVDRSWALNIHKATIISIDPFEWICKFFFDFDIRESFFIDFQWILFKLYKSDDSFFHLE